MFDRRIPVTSLALSAMGACLAANVAGFAISFLASLPV